MTMFTLPNFCRVCLKYDKNLIDLEHIENEPSETLMSKLQQCVAEVEWNVFKPLLCHPCIKRLNIAYTFRKQCVQSASMLKSYVALVKDHKTKEAENAKSDITQGSAYMMLPNQKYIQIVVGPQAPNAFHNYFLNVIPTPAVNSTGADSKNNSKDTNQNVFLNINNTFQKFIPSNQGDDAQNGSDMDQLLIDDKSEELSVEIDPTDLGLGDGGSSDNDESENGGLNDWEDLISTQITQKSNGVTINNGRKSMYTNFVPILPKQSDKMDFSNSGQHFLSSPLEFLCDSCQKHFPSLKQLRNHIKVAHAGKTPFTCHYCLQEYVLQMDYEACMKSHKGDPSLTLKDFDPLETTTELMKPAELADLNCELCKRQFNSASGLLRHKVRKHNQKSKKKYFIKGMKNAKCDICNREFSTQSYMQLHRKLHLRDDTGYKYKVFSKNRYVKNILPKPEVSKEGEQSDSDEEKAQMSDNQNPSNNVDEDGEVREENLQEDLDTDPEGN